MKMVAEHILAGFAIKPGNHSHFCRYSIDMHALRAKLYKENGEETFLPGIAIKYITLGWLASLFQTRAGNNII